MHWGKPIVQAKSPPYQLSAAIGVHAHCVCKVSVHLRFQNLHTRRCGLLSNYFDLLLYVTTHCTGVTYLTILNCNSVKPLSCTGYVASKVSPAARRQAPAHGSVRAVRLCLCTRVNNNTGEWGARGQAPFPDPGPPP